MRLRSVCAATGGVIFPLSTDYPNRSPGGALTDSTCCLYVGASMRWHHFPERSILMATRIYVGNLPYSATNEQLTDLFSAFGEVSEATIITDRDTGQAKGFGFVQMAQDDAARSAIAQLDGTALDNRTLRVNEAQARTARNDRNSTRTPRW